MLAFDGTFCVVLPASEEDAFRECARTFQLVICKRLLIYARGGQGWGTARVLLAFRLSKSLLPDNPKPFFSTLLPGDHKTRGDSGEMSVRGDSGYSADYISLTRQYYAVALDSD
jgi:hypothetical protein